MKLYRYSCNAEGRHIVGETWNTHRDKVIADVKGNYSDAKRIIVVQLKPGTFDYACAIQRTPNPDWTLIDTSVEEEA